MTKDNNLIKKINFIIFIKLNLIQLFFVLYDRYFMRESLAHY